MRIEIILGQAGSRSYYQIERNELIIGSSNQCHLLLPNSEISRRHLSLIQRGDRYFVIDHGSTNGSFLDEQKIEPGQKAEWKVNTPMRLATGVILTLVDDASDGDEDYMAPASERINPDHTRTMVIPLAQLKASAKKSSPPPVRKKRQKKQGMGKAVVIVAAILGIAYYLNVEKDIRIKRKPKTIPASAKSGVETTTNEVFGQSPVSQ